MAEDIQFSDIKIDYLSIADARQHHERLHEVLQGHPHSM